MEFCEVSTSAYTINVHRAEARFTSTWRHIWPFPRIYADKCGACFYLSTTLPTGDQPELFRLREERTKEVVGHTAAKEIKNSRPENLENGSRRRAQGTRKNSNLEIGISKLKNHNPKFAIRNSKFEMISLSVTNGF